MFRHAVGAIGLGLLAWNPLFAGTFGTLNATNDAATGISTSKSYSHAVDIFGDDGSGAANGAIINGIKFGADTGSNYTLNTNNSFNNHNPAGVTPGGFSDLLDDFRYGGVSGTSTLTLTNLTPGQTYTATFFSSDFGTRNVNITASDTGATTLFNQNIYGGLQYSYTPTGNSITFTFDAVNDGDTWHHYGFANQYAAGSGPFTVKQFSGDADSGVKAGNVYTHAVDLKGSPGAGTVNVNGVTFVEGSTGTYNGGYGNTYTLSGAGNAFNGDVTNVTGGIGSMLDDFMYGNAGQNATLTLNGLETGEVYELNLYANGFGDPAGRFVTLVADDGSLVFDANAYGDGNGTMLTYRYTASGPSESFLIDPAGDDTFHWYAFSNVMVTPEPGSLVAMAIAGVAVFGFAWLRRRPRS